ncbi:MAG: tetratricopeptide repeat protein [Phycisphaerae bacterium]|nr:tetratricopeptide repeat protein [Phycisphaerae bacterium]
MSYLLETLGRGLVGRLLNVFAHHLPSVDDDSIESLRAKRKFSPSSSDLATRLGTLYLREMRFGEARDAFATALELAPESRAARIGLACALDDLTGPEDAIRHLTMAAAQDPTDPALAFGLGYCFERQGDTTAATGSYRHAAELHPYLRNAYERTAAIAIQQGDWATAIEEYKQLDDLVPEDLEILLTLATLHLQNNDVEIAIDLYQRALLVEPECDGMLGEAEQLIEEGRVEEAIESVRDLVERFPGVPDFHVHLGDMYVQAGDKSRAIAEYRAALDYHPGFLEATIKLGTQQLRQGELIDAAQSFMRAVELNDRLITAFVGLGVSQDQIGRLEEAKATFDLAASLEPNSTLLFSETTRLQLSAETNGPAPIDDNGEPMAAATLTSHDVLSAALQRHEQALQLHPNHADLHYRYGLLLRQLGECEQAIAAFQNAISINPQYSKALIKLGVCLTELGRLDEAITVFHRAIALRADYVDVNYQLGLLFTRQGRFDLAVEEFEHAVAGNERNISFRANLALALQNIGLVDRAQATWHAICDLSRETAPHRSTRESVLRSLRQDNG